MTEGVFYSILQINGWWRLVLKIKKDDKKAKEKSKKALADMKKEVKKIEKIKKVL